MRDARRGAAQERLSTQKCSMSTRCQKMECSSTSISALGKRARETLADERRKRKTIQVLNDTVARQLPLPVDSSAPKRRPASSTSQKTTIVPNNTNPAASASSCSRVVRLYIHAEKIVEDVSLVTPDIIYKFFLGLEEELEKIFVLLPYPLLVTPLDDDPTAMSSSMQKGCSWLRTFVQFTSNTVADLAVQRSGEAISWRTSSSSEEEHHHCVTIVVQPIRYDSTVLTQKMAIDAIRGEPLHTTVQRVQDCLPSVSNHLVFCMAASLLRLSHLNNNTDEERKKRIILLQDRTTTTNMHSALQRVCDYAWTTPTTTTEDYLVRLYNSFWDCHAEVERTCSALFLLASGTKLENSILRIVESLQNWLLDEMEEMHIQIMQHHCTSSSLPASNTNSENALPSR